MQFLLLVLISLEVLVWYQEFLTTPTISSFCISLGIACFCRLVPFYEKINTVACSEIFFFSRWIEETKLWFSESRRGNSAKSLFVIRHFSSPETILNGLHGKQRRFLKIKIIFLWDSVSLSTAATSYCIKWGLNCSVLFVCWISFSFKYQIVLALTLKTVDEHVRELSFELGSI